MSFLSKIPPELQHYIVDGAKEIAGLIWHRITGEHDDATATSLAHEAAEKIAQLAIQEAQNKLGAHALEQALKKLGERAAEMQPWADDMISKIKKMNEDDRQAFSMPTVPAFDNSDTPVDDPEKK